MLAIDLDGTLLDRRGRVSRANREAVEAARGAGIAVTVCTGRGLVECEHVLAEIGQVETVVVAGGSILSCPVSRRTVHRFSIDPALVSGAVECVLGRGHPVLVLKDPVAAGYDYLVVVGPDEHRLDPVTRWWFERMRVKVRYVRSLAEDEHPEHTVRVGACGRCGALAELKAELMGICRERVVMHHFPAVVAPENVRELGKAGAGGEIGESIHVLEVFDCRATKWAAIQWLAAERGVPEARIGAIGDEINDVSMIRGAGLGVAMGNAVPEVQAAARRRTRSNDDDGVAWAIGRILSGEW